MKTKCSKKIWDKFTPAEKKMWTMCYRTFSDMALRKATITKEDYLTIAHNHACEVVWLYQSIAKKTISHFN